MAKPRMRPLFSGAANAVNGSPSRRNGIRACVAWVEVALLDDMAVLRLMTRSNLTGCSTRLYLCVEQSTAQNSRRPLRSIGCRATSHSDGLELRWRHLAGRLEDEGEVAIYDLACKAGMAGDRRLCTGVGREHAREVMLAAQRPAG